jgi:hypothetical protein
MWLAVRAVRWWLHAGQPGEGDAASAALSIAVLTAAVIAGGKPAYDYLQPVGARTVATANQVVSGVSQVQECPYLRPLLEARSGYVNMGGFSQVDSELAFKTCKQLLAYAPKALMLTLLAPMPTQWLQPGGSVGFARYFSAIDAVLLWLLFPGLVVGLALAVIQPRGARGIIAVYVIALGLVLGLVVSNFGSLFRLRLQVILPAAVLAVDGWTWLVTELRSRLDARASEVTTRQPGLEAPSVQMARTN